MRFENYLYEAAGDASKTTRLQECLHCVGFGVYQILKKNITEEDMLNPDLFNQSIQKYCNIDTGEGELWDFQNENPSWLKSVVTAINTGFNSGHLKKKNYTYYRGTGLMNDIYSQFNKLKVMNGVKLSNDKWNPSDIWASTENTVPQFDNLSAFNEYIADSLKKGTTIGISLKKVGKTAKAELENQKGVKMKSLEYKGIQSPREIFSTGILILTNTNMSINFRSFRISKQADITGELVMKGGSARHGKIPSSVKNDKINKYKIPQMPKSKIKSTSDNLLIKMVVDLWRDCGITFPKSKIEKDWEKRVDNIQDRVGYWQSIIHALELGAFLNQNKSLADQIINDFYIGASSASEFSSQFIKIY